MLKKTKTEQIKTDTEQEHFYKPIFLFRRICDSEPWRGNCVCCAGAAGPASLMCLGRWALPLGWLFVHTVFHPDLSFNNPPVSYSPTAVIMHRRTTMEVERTHGTMAVWTGTLNMPCCEALVCFLSWLRLIGQTWHRKWLLGLGALNRHTHSTPWFYAVYVQVCIAFQACPPPRQV